MRRMLLTTLTLCFYNVISQKIEVPPQVMNAFETSVPNAKKVEWSNEKDEHLWTVKYKLNGKKHESNYFVNGTWESTEKKIRYSQLPKPIQEHLDEFLKVTSVYQQDTPDEVFYIVKGTYTHEGIEYYSGFSFYSDGEISHFWDISQKQAK